MGVRHLEYAYQEKPNGGIADALLLGEDFADNGPVTVILGDNTCDADIRNHVSSFSKGATIFLKKVEDRKQLHRFGVAVFDRNKPDKIVKIEEKPSQPKSNYVATGLYIFDAHIFDYIRQCKPSGREELEITDVNNIYIGKGTMNWVKLTGFWSDAGTFETLFRANRYWAEKAGM